jgi:hypothetical protein
MRRCLQRSCGIQSGGGKRAVAALPGSSIFIAARRSALSSRQREEAGTTPGGAGDGAGDGGEAGIGRALPIEAIGYGRDGVAQALIVAHQHRPGLSRRRGEPPWRAKPSKNLRLSRSRPPKAHSCRRQAIIRPSRSLLRSVGGVRPKMTRQRRRSASMASERRCVISASIAAGSVEYRRMEIELGLKALGSGCGVNNKDVHLD